MSLVLVAQDDCLPDAPSKGTSGSMAYVHDFANVLSTGQERQLSQRLANFRKKTSNEIIFISSPDLCGYEPITFGYKVGDKWGIGQADLDNGLVIVFKPKTADSRGRVAVVPGSGLEGVLTDLDCGIIVDEEMIPLFKKGQTFQGILKGLSVIEDIVEGEYSFANYNEDLNSFPKQAWIPIIIVLVFLIVWFISVYNYAKTNKISFWKAMVLMSQTRNTHRGGWGDFNRGRGGFGGYVGRGGGGHGGGFGGFGGGSFGGGGASGSW